MEPLTKRQERMRSFQPRTTQGRLKKIGVYAIRHVPSGRMYVGGTRDIHGRWSNHRFRLRNNVHHTPELQQLWNEAGENSFVFHVLEVCPLHRLQSAEEFWIATSGHILNACPTAEPGLYVKASEEKKRASRLKWQNPNYRKIMLENLAKAREAYSKSRRKFRPMHKPGHW